MYLVHVTAYGWLLLLSCWPVYAQCPTQWKPTSFDQPVLRALRMLAAMTSLLKTDKSVMTEPYSVPGSAVAGLLSHGQTFIQSVKSYANVSRREP